VSAGSIIGRYRKPPANIKVVETPALDRRKTYTQALLFRGERVMATMQGTSVLRSRPLPRGKLGLGLKLPKATMRAKIDIASLELRIDNRTVARGQAGARRLAYTDRTTSEGPGPHTIQLVALERPRRFVASTQIVDPHED
jgi:hypothetical protein